MAFRTILICGALWSLQVIGVLGLATNNDTNLGLLPYSGVRNEEPESFLTKRQTKSDINVAIYLRGHLMFKEKRLAAGTEAFHWGIHVTPENAPGKTTEFFNAVNAKKDGKVDAKLFRYERRLTNPLKQEYLLGRVKIGTMPSTASVETVHELLSQIPMPNKYKCSSGSCVTWAMDGVRKLQENGIVERFETSGFAEKVTQYGEEQFVAILHADTMRGSEMQRQKISRYDAQKGDIVADEPAQHPQPPNPSEPEQQPGSSGGQESQDSTGKEPEDPSLLCQRAGTNCVPRKPGDKSPTAETPAKVEEVSEAELMAIATQRSKENFDGLLKEFDYGSVLSHDQLYGELNVQLQKEFGTLPRGERIAGFTVKTGEGMLAIAGLALYGKAVADVFSTDTTALDKAAVVTSIIPGIGCAVQLADEVQRGNVAAGHIALCFAEDALMVTGFWEISLAIQLAESLSDFIDEDAKQRELFNTEVFRKKGMDGWNHNFKRLLEHLASSDFTAFSKNKFSTYQLLILYQASQLSGELHASHNAIAAKFNVPTKHEDHNAHIVEHLQPELRRQVCTAIAHSKYQLSQKLESIALDHIKKLEHEYKEQFFRDYREAATKPINLMGILMPQNSHNIQEIDRVISEARDIPLPLYENVIKKVIAKVIERLEAPEPCMCLQGRNKKRCEFEDCISPEHPRGYQDLGEKVYVKNILSEEIGHQTTLSPECVALFTPCQDPETGSETGRQLWCIA